MFGRDIARHFAAPPAPRVMLACHGLVRRALSTRAPHASASSASPVSPRASASSPAARGAFLAAAVTLALVTTRRSRASSAVASAAAAAMSGAANREDELRELWADAYDGWIDVPGGPVPNDDDAAAGGVGTTDAVDDEGVITPARSPPSSSSPSSPHPRRRSRPSLASRLFALTAHNPMGEPARRPRTARRTRLESELAALRSPAPVASWRARIRRRLAGGRLRRRVRPRGTRAAERAVVSLASTSRAPHAYEPMEGRPGHHQEDARGDSDAVGDVAVARCGAPRGRASTIARREWTRRRNDRARRENRPTTDEGMRV